MVSWVPPGITRQIEGCSSAGDDGRAFQRFWEGAIRWLVRDPALTLLRIDLDKVEYRRSQTVSARVRTLRTDYTGASGVEVALELRPVEVSESAAPLRAVKIWSSLVMPLLAVALLAAEWTLRRRSGHA